ncbi:hypothetical protein F3Y22_tig00008222pilonHSYRG00020 [Hibiscus syriacus]|uniref:Uncharacterized protein n=1 Tax=Hibiscus syriacus TaxID=106335 RepID=A0A6A3CEQ7_HIBSY|nr:hypothetical protein F3Y22_tig00008222pilonHSYRG00020 [Hibiscus syriacus]
MKTQFTLTGNGNPSNNENKGNIRKLSLPLQCHQGSSRIEWYKSLGNPVQADTMTYHLSVLRNLFPRGINVLSLLSGIGGAEIVLYQLSIPLKADVQELNDDRLEQLMSRFGGFDLIVGGIPFLKFKFNNLLKDIMDIILTKKMIGLEDAAMMYQDLSQYHSITRVNVFGMCVASSRA